MEEKTLITSPVTKALTALGAGGGASVVSAANSSAVNFFALPTDLAGWVALAASTAAFLYTITIWSEWWWKKFWRPKFVEFGWAKPVKGASFSVDEEGNVTRIEGP